MLLRKLRTFVSHPVASVEAKRRKTAGRRRRAREREERELRAERSFATEIPDLYAAVQEFHRGRPSGAIGPEWDDLWFLYSIVRERKPQTMLEFGSGCSTVVFAAALRDNESGHLWSVDQEAAWAESTAAGLPAELQKFVTLRHLPKPDPARRELVPDFAYLDGWGVNDLIALEPRLEPGFMLVIDGRRQSADKLKERWTRRYRYEKQPGRHIFELLG